MTAAQKRVERAIAGAFAKVDALWSTTALERLVDNEHRSGPELLREQLIEALASELELAIYPERFESLLDALRMTA